MASFFTYPQTLASHGYCCRFHVSAVDIRMQLVFIPIFFHEIYSLLIFDLFFNISE